MGLGARLAISFTVLVALTAVLIGGASVFTTGRQVTSEIDDFLRDRADEIVDGTRDKPQGRDSRSNGRSDDNDSDGSQTVTVGTQLAVDADAEVQLLDSSGDVTAVSGIALPVDDRDVRLAAREEPARIRTVSISGTDYRMITEHIPGGGAVQVARSLDEAASLVSLLRSRLFINAGVLAAFAGLAGWALAQRTTRPLRSLTAAVDAVAETRDFTVPVDASGNDEVGRLARGFDRMLRALERSRSQQHRLVQDAAHELRTPLTSIKANIDWLAMADDIDAETRRTVLVGVQRELGELNTLMAEIIDLATDSQEQRPHVPIDLAVVATDAADQFRARSPRAVEVRSDPTPVRGDADSLGRAITNLLSNADKYSPAGAPITVEVADGWVWVADRGAGIPEAERERVFDRFYRRDADRSAPGSGLGLSIVASIAEAHGGRVAIGDTPGGGARVGFGLPTT